MTANAYRYLSLAWYIAVQVEFVNQLSSYCNSILGAWVFKCD